MKAIQDYYAENYSHCYGCGPGNPKGMQIKSYPDGEQTVCRYTPGIYYTGGFPDSLYGGILASLIDCHAAATASYAKLCEQGLVLGDVPSPRFVTASLKVDYLKPAPSGREVELRGRAVEIKNRKITVHVTLSVDGDVKVKGEVLMIQLREENA